MGHQQYRCGGDELPAPRLLAHYDNRWPNLNVVRGVSSSLKSPPSQRSLFESNLVRQPVFVVEGGSSVHRTAVLRRILLDSILPVHQTTHVPRTISLIKQNMDGGESIFQRTTPPNSNLPVQRTSNVLSAYLLPDPNNNIFVPDFLHKNQNYLDICPEIRPTKLLASARGNVVWLKLQNRQDHILF